MANKGDTHLGTLGQCILLKYLISPAARSACGNILFDINSIDGGSSKYAEARAVYGVRCSDKAEPIVRHASRTSHVIATPSHFNSPSFV